MTPDDELRAIAEAATPVAWRTHDNYNYVVDANRRTICLLHGSVGSFANAVNNARFIATFDPPTVKGLLAEIERLDNAVRYTLEQVDYLRRLYGDEGVANGVSTRLRAALEVTEE